jgi:membrane associated rhomboid family serine protease
MQNPPPERKRHPLEEPPPQAASPTATEAPRRRLTLRIAAVSPTVTYVLIAICVGVFLLRAVSFDMDRNLLEWGANSAESTLRDGQTYRLFTSMFLHQGIYDSRGQQNWGGIAHLLFNMYTLYAVGATLERLFGHARFLIVYLLGGLFGSVLSALLNGPGVTSVGASGAVFAIISAEFVYLYFHRKLMGEAGRQRRNSLIGFFVLNAAFGLLTLAPGSQLRIDNWAHLGGALGGAALAWFISPRYNLRVNPANAEEVFAEDVNPLKGRYWVIPAWVTIMLVLVFIGVQINRA